MFTRLGRKALHGGGEANAQITNSFILLSLHSASSSSARSGSEFCCFAYCVAVYGVRDLGIASQSVSCVEAVRLAKRHKVKKRNLHKIRSIQKGR